jgi:hypothetical protein
MRRSLKLTVKVTQGTLLALVGGGTSVDEVKVYIGFLRTLLHFYKIDHFVRLRQQLL